VKLAQSCQSAPTALITGKTERSGSTRDAGQQTSEMQLMPTATVTETVWTFSQPDAATSTTALGPTDDDVQSSSGAPHPTEPTTSPAAATEDMSQLRDNSIDVQVSDTIEDAYLDTDDLQCSKVTITKDDDETSVAASNRLGTTDMYEDWSAPFAAAEKVCIYSGPSDSLMALRP